MENKKKKLSTIKILGAIGIVTFISLITYQVSLGYNWLYSIEIGFVCGLGIVGLLAMPSIAENTKFKDEYYGFRITEIKEQPKNNPVKKEKIIESEISIQDKIDYLKESRESLTKETIKKKNLEYERFK